MSTLEEQIAAQLHNALDRMVAAGAWAMQAERGLVAAEADPVIRLTIEDVARIAAAVAAAPDEPGEYHPELRMFITDAGRARMRARLADAESRRDPQARAELLAKLRRWPSV